jgi:CheY-like chemotaxis protein
LGIKKLKILVIEDDLIEVMKLKRAVDKLALDITLLDAKNGEEALDLLGNHQNLPDLIFLDLNMPKISGLEFLAIVRYLPTVILTTSNNRKDVLECYKMGVAGYILKPLKYDEYVDKIHKALLYWSENELIKI